MDNNRIKTWFAIIGAISLISLSFFIGRKSVDVPNITTEVRWDTLKIEKPIPRYIDKVRTEYVYVHTPADTVVIEHTDTIVRDIVRIDSALVAVDVERLVYQDSLYRAVVSGAVVGNIHPSLDEINVYTRNETRIIERPSPLLRPYISASIGKELIGIGGGVSIKDMVDIGAQYMRIGSKNMFVVGASYRFNIKSK